MLIYASTITQRLQYITNVLFGNEHIPYTLTTNENTFKEYKGIKICYADTNIDATSIHIIPHGLLWQQTIEPQNIEIKYWENLPVFFSATGNIPFDIFSAAFFLLSRYEEYLPHSLDEYGRFAHTNSLACKHNFLHLPLVNLWIEAFKIEAIKHFHLSASTFYVTPFSFTPTYDIDIAYAYQHQPILKNVAGFFKHFLQGNINAVQERLTVLTGQQPDIFDVYDWLHQLHQQHQLHPIYFFLVAAKRSKYDKNISPVTKAFQQLIQQHKTLYATGVHPSWQSYNNTPLLQKEINDLSKITQATCHHSRQHYIKISLPKSYEQFIATGILHDYSMGYGSINGFRASYTKPYLWYNLTTEQATPLTLHPFCYMDANAIFEEQLSVEVAKESLQHYYHIVKQVHGNCIVIHHNHFLTKQPEWIEWRKMYEAFLHSIA